ncbi:MAG: pyruvate kinase [Bacteroidales bacterium]
MQYISHLIDKPLLSQVKIVATIGPACNNKKTLSAMIEAGLNVCRLNLSHGTLQDHLEAIKLIRQLSSQMGIPISILADLQGPKLRIGNIENDVILIKDTPFTLVSNPMQGNEHTAYMSYTDFPKVVKPGEEILIDDGKIRLKVIKTNNIDRVETLVINGGPLFSHKGVNLPHTQINLPSLTEKDRQDAIFALHNQVDWLGLSFVRKAQDILELRKLVQEEGKDGQVGILAKIEKPEALACLEEILDVADALMVARGDLGVEVSFEQIPIIQKDIIRQSVAKGKPVIVATQMLESMIHNFVPTRAEANDVANAVLDGADAVMLSGETSVGDFPVESVQAMDSIIRFTEIKGFRFKPKQKPDPESSTFTKETICFSATKMASQANVQAIVLFVDSVQAVLSVASYRPYTKILVFTTNPFLQSALSFVWGVEIFSITPLNRTAEAVNYANALLLKQNILKTGDRVVYLSHIPFHEHFGNINTIRLEVIE